MKRRKLKKQVYYFLFFIVIAIIGAIYGLKQYKQYKYEQTYEYKLTEHGYTLEEAKTLDKKLTDKDLEFILSIRKTSTLVDLVNEEYFISKNFNDYYSYYLKHKKEDFANIIAIINTKVNNDYYSLDLQTDMSKGDAIIVNKYYRLDNSYSPDDLVTVPMDYAWGEEGSIVVRKVAYEAFLNMWQGAKEAGHYLMISSAYRSYQEQEIVYNNYKNTYGEDYANKIAAVPGYSEHQTGLAIDVFTKTNSNRKTFKDSEAAKWLADNAYKYGFILRYPEDKVKYTGYDYESWHFRYVGKDIAKEVFDKDITFDEYYAYYLDK